MVDIGGDDGAAPGDLVADEFGGDEIGDGGAEALAFPCLGRSGTSTQVFSLRDVLHFRSNDSLPGVMHLRHIAAGTGAQHALADAGEGRDATAAVGAELAVVLRPNLALVDF